MENSPQKKTSVIRKWLKKFGVTGFILFFTIKGLVWLVIFYFGADTLRSCAE